VKPKDVKKYVAGLVGEEPTESEDTTTSKTPDIDTSTVTVDVANASDVGGLANGVAEALNSLGYGQGEVGNYTGKSVNGTTVFAHSADDDSAKAVAAALGGLPTDTDATLPEGSVRVVLASDYQGPTSAESTSTTSSSSGSSETGLEPVSTGGTTPTPAPPGPPIDAGSSGPRCVN
jgi:dienelactone hydrolase